MLDWLDACIYNVIFRTYYIAWSVSFGIFVKSIVNCHPDCVPNPSNSIGCISLTCDLNWLCTLALCAMVDYDGFSTVAYWLFTNWLISADLGQSLAKTRRELGLMALCIFSMPQRHKFLDPELYVANHSKTRRKSAFLFFEVFQLLTLKYLLILNELKQFCVLKQHWVVRSNQICKFQLVVYSIDAINCF